MTDFVSGTAPYSEQERERDRRVSREISEAQHRGRPRIREPLKVKPDKPHQKLLQLYDSRGSSGHRRAYDRMIGSD